MSGAGIGEAATAGTVCGTGRGEDASTRVHVERTDVRWRAMPPEPTIPEAVRPAMRRHLGKFGTVAPLDRCESLLRRLNARVRTSAGCWTWEGGTVDGYGKITAGGRTLPVHRVVYELLVGPIPDSLQLDHLCRNRRCCNPAHLEAVTNRVNQLRGIGFSAVNAAKTHCVRGHLLSGANINTSRGFRECRECNRIRDRAKKAAKREHLRAERRAA